MAVDTFFEGSLKRKRGAGAGARQRVTNGNGAQKAGRGGRGGSTRTRVGSSSSRKENERARSRQNKKSIDRDEDLGGSNDSDNSGEDSFADGGETSPMDGDEDLLDSEEEADAKETAAQKRIRLARMYLDSLKTGKDREGADAAEMERDIIAERLQKDVLETSGKLHLRIADKLSLPPLWSRTTSNKVHRLPVTCAVAREDCSQLFTASKDGSVARYDVAPLISSTPLAALTSGPSVNDKDTKIQKLDYIAKCRSESSSSRKGKNRASESKGKPDIKKNQPSQDQDTPGHTDEIYSLSLSMDGSRMASGGKDRRIGIWDTSNTAATKDGEGCKWMRGLRGHKDSIASIKFRMGTSQLYTSSFDRTVKVYDATSLAYIETLFGHQDKIYDISVLKNELAVTAGGRDKTLRYWKIKDESQLVFRAGTTSRIRQVIEGGLEDVDEEDNEAFVNRSKTKKESEKRYVEGSADCTAMIDDQHFLSGGDSGTISLWAINKKKPIFTLPLAHGLNEFVSESEGIIGNPRWIVSLATLPYSDIFASGSWDGKIRLWKISDDLRSFALIGSIDGLGYVNSLQMLQLPANRRKASNRVKVISSNLEAQGQQGVMIVAALGQEHKFGRWKKLKEAKNVAMVAVLELKVDRS